MYGELVQKIEILPKMLETRKFMDDFKILKWLTGYIHS